MQLEEHVSPILVTDYLGHDLVEVCALFMLSKLYQLISGRLPIILLNLVPKHLYFFSLS